MSGPPTPAPSPDAAPETPGPCCEVCTCRLQRAGAAPRAGAVWWCPSCTIHYDGSGMPLPGRFGEAAAAEAEEAAAFEGPEAALEDELDEERCHAAPKRKKQTPGQAEVLVKLAADADLFHSPDGSAYATLRVGKHRETRPVLSAGLKGWLRHAFYETEGKPPSAQALADAVGMLEARAQFDGAEIPVAVRVGAHGERLYIDLGDRTWRAAEVDSHGWRVVAEPPVRFVRSAVTLALPEPAPGGDIEELRPFVNLPGDDEFLLLTAWLVAALRSDGPFPLLVLQGEHGVAKSTTARLLRALVDPNVAALRALPRDERDLAIAAHHSWILAFDNLSGLPTWLSDALCRLATGGGFAARRLYSDDDEIIFDSRRPLVITGINNPATRPDLADRSLFVTLPAIPEERRLTEAVLWRRFEAARPRLLGALLSGVSSALRNQETANLARLPRMADFSMWIVAAEAGLGVPPGAFMRAYAGNRGDAISESIENDDVARTVLLLLDGAGPGGWEGTASDLLSELRERLEAAGIADVLRRRSWPGSPSALTRRLRQIIPALRHLGVVVVLPERTKGRPLQIRRGEVRRNAVQADAPSLDQGNQALAGDGVGDGIYQEGEMPSSGKPLKAMGVDCVDGVDGISADLILRGAAAMTPAQLLDHLHHLGARLTVEATPEDSDEPTLRIRAPRGTITPELREALLTAKPAIIDLLRGDTCDPVVEDEPAHSLGAADRAEDEDQVQRFRDGKNVVVIWSGVLNEKVALVATEEAKRLVPEAIVTYTSDEVKRLGSLNLGAEALRLMHAAKKAIHGVVDEVEPDDSAGADTGNGKR